MVFPWGGRPHCFEEGTSSEGSTTWESCYPSASSWVGSKRGLLLQAGIGRLENPKGYVGVTTTTTLQANGYTHLAMLMCLRRQHVGT